MNTHHLFSTITDEQGEKVVGGEGTVHVDYCAEDEYCPFCKSNHEIIHCKETRELLTGTFPLMFCPRKLRSFFEGKKGYYDWNGYVIR